jgi:hypothetical protein
MTRLKDDTHTALTESSFQLITSVEDRFAQQRLSGGIAILRTMIYVIGEAAPTGWTFFH